MRLAQLAKQHGQGLRPAVEPARMSFRLGLGHGALKI
jgi:hypothetical protein